MNDTLYNFNSNIDNEDVSLKLNMDELYTKKQQQDLNVLNNYNKILVRIHNKIKYISKQLINDQCCWYVVPEMMLGIPKYNHNDCTVYVIQKLRENGFIIRYTHPNLLFICWKHWIPTYVRNEVKKQTGNQIDEYGNIINKKYEDENLVNDNNDDNNYNNLIINNRNKNNKTKAEYKDVKSYNPSGNLIYSNNLLKKLDINS